MNIAAAINGNRLALLRMVFCWLAVAYCLGAPRNKYAAKPLPRRLAEWVDLLISKAEKAAGYLLIAVYYHEQIKEQRNSSFEKAALNFAAHNCALRLGGMTIPTIKKRLKALQHILHNLEIVVRRLVKAVAARARVVVMHIAANSLARKQRSFTPCMEKAVPP